MKKVICLIAGLLALAGCAPSPTAVTVGKNKVDASELAFYVNYNMRELESRYGMVAQGGLYDEEHLKAAKARALEQIAAAEIVRIKCVEFKLKLDETDRAFLKESKDELVVMLGGKAAYLDYLNGAFLTDRAYDKMQQNGLYYDMLYAYVAQELDQALFDDAGLRAFFSEYYTRVKYIRFSLLDESGEQLDEKSRATQYEAACAVFEQAQNGADFDQLIETYNDDERLDLEPGGLMVSAAEARESAYLNELFALAPGEVGGPYADTDGYYLIRRYDAEPGYFQENKDMIRQNAVDHNFASHQAVWLSEIRITTHAPFERMNFDNIGSFLK